jgi:predicted dehydrogenase
MMLRIGIVGTGAMAEYHARRFSGLAGVRVCAVCDRQSGRAAAFAEKMGLVSFSDPGDMASSGLVDAVTVASADGWHRAPVLAAFERGLPVFCEKPLARTLEDAEAMAAAAESSGLPALVNFSKRNGGLLSLVRRIAEGSEFGPLSSLELAYSQSWLLQDAWGDYSTSPRWKWRLSESLSTFGVMGDLGSHLFDTAILIAGERLSALSCSAIRYAEEPGYALEGGGSFESFEARLGCGRKSAAIKAGWREEDSLDSFALRMRGGGIELELDLERSRSSLLVQKNGSTREISAPKQPTTYERFVAMATGGPDPVTGEEIGFSQGLRVQRLIQECSALATR